MGQSHDGHGYGHRHSRGHRHGHAPPAGADDPQSERRLLWGVGLNLAITVAEVIGGLVSGSLALLSDALHNFSDTASLGISYGARRIARRGPTQQKTFGYRRAEVIGAFINLVTLVLIALFLVHEAVGRLFEPAPIDAPVMLIVAVIGLLANIATALLLAQDVEGSLNIRSVFLHIVADAISSVSVIVGGLLIWQFDLVILDPILTLLLAVYILYHSYGMLRETIDLLMEGAPADLDLDAVVNTMESVEQVLEIHHLHVWQLDETRTALEAHVVIPERMLSAMEDIKRRLKARLQERHRIEHSTLEFEVVPCGPEADTDCYEHPSPLPETATAT